MQSRTVSKQRISQLRYPDRTRARSITTAAIKAGRLKRPDRCQDCGSPGRPEAHHEDYSKPLVVVWVCRPCHCARHIAEVRCSVCGGEVGHGGNKKEQLCARHLRRKRAHGDPAYERVKKRCACGVERIVARGMCGRCLYAADPDWRERVKAAGARWRKRNPEKVKVIVQRAQKAYRERKRGVAPSPSGPRNREKMHCPAGHLYSPENTYVFAGKRYCRTCRRERRRVKNPPR